jgi:hypothetical protein
MHQVDAIARLARRLDTNKTAVVIALLIESLNIYQRQGGTRAS